MELVSFLVPIVSKVFNMAYFGDECWRRKWLSHCPLKKNVPSFTP